MASVHLYDKASVWFQQFTKLHGEEVNWQMFEEPIEKRFGMVYDDPMEDLKNLK